MWATEYDVKRDWNSCTLNHRPSGHLISLLNKISYPSIEHKPYCWNQSQFHPAVTTTAVSSKTWQSDPSVLFLILNLAVLYWSPDHPHTGNALNWFKISYHGWRFAHLIVCFMRCIKQSFAVLTNNIKSETRGFIAVCLRILEVRKWSSGHPKPLKIREMCSFEISEKNFPVMSPNIQKSNRFLFY